MRLRRWEGARGKQEEFGKNKNKKNASGGKVCHLESRLPLREL